MRIISVLYYSAISISNLLQEVLVCHLRSAGREKLLLTQLTQLSSQMHHNSEKHLKSVKIIGIKKKLSHNEVQQGPL